MAQKMMDLSCADFASALAAKASVPGGGGAAAYAGALGVALGSMAGNFTVGKKAYAQVEDQVRDLLAEGEGIRERLLGLVEADAAAFEPLSRAYGIPKDDPTRAEVLETATKEALQAPLQMMREICEAIAMLEKMERVGSKMLVSDVGCGASLCAAALEMASLNVFINTKSLADRDYAVQVEAECDTLLETYLPRARDVAKRVGASIRG